MGNTWTNEQKAAMDITDKTVLVSAAAGSGKTSVLTERIIRRLTDPDKPARLSEMLIVTFTRASAADLKAKIGNALSNALAENPGNQHLRDQLLSLGSAQISTIDSFFQKIVRSSFDELDLPASFRTVDETEVLPLALSLLQSMSEQYYEGMARENGGDTLSRIKNNPFAEAMDHLMSGRSDGKLDAILYRFYKQFASYPEGIELLKKCADRLMTEQNLPFFETVTGNSIRQSLTDRFTSYQAFLLESTEKIKADPAHYKKFFDILTFDTDYVFAVLNTLEKKDYQAVRNAVLSFKSCKVKFPTIKATEKRHEEQAYQNWRKVFKERQRKLYEWFEWSEADISAQFQKTAQLCQTLYRFFKDFKAKFCEEKLARGVMEYSDIREYIYRLLTNPDGTPSPAAEAISGQYKEVYIDEYQDVDSLQDMIFARVGGRNRFMVGDIKQSIYGFRGSDPSVFAGYRRAFPLYTDPAAERSSSTSVFMSDNFRCNESVVCFTNHVCGFLFSACEQSIGYRPQDDLKFSKKAKEGAPPDLPVCVAVFDAKPRAQHRDTDEDDEEGNENDAVNSSINAEAAWVANEIRTLIQNNSPDNKNSIHLSDIAILVRAKNHAIGISRALESIGIPVVAEAANNIMHEPLMVDMLNLLRAIDNPYRDLPLSEFLLSPLGGFSLEELTRIRASVTDQKAVFDALTAYATDGDDSALCQKTSRFLAWLEPLFESAALLPADKFLRLLYLDALLLPYQGDPVLLYLYEQARVYQKTAFCGVYGLIDAMNKQQESNTVPKNGFKKAENAVAVMTVHHSKGLEFPVVFLCGCGKTFNKDDLRQSLLFHKKVGCASKLYDPLLDETSNSILHVAAQTEIAQEQAEESIRTLYVALTRAKERLYVTGTLSGARGNAIDNAELVRRGDRTSILDVNSYLGWILAALYDKSLSSNQPMPCTLNFYSHVPMALDGEKSAEPLPQETAKADRLPLPEELAEYVPLLEDQADHPYPLAFLNGLPTKAAASKLTSDLVDRLLQKDGEEEAVTEAQLDLMLGATASFDDLLLANQTPTAADIGTATHAFLQFCQFKRLYEGGVDRECDALCTGGFISDSTARILNKKQLQAFVSSDLMQELLSAKTVRREQKFHLFVPFSDLTKQTDAPAELAEHSLYVQGSIDLLIETVDGELLLFDYKTDHITSAERQDEQLLQSRMRLLHGDQLSYYRKAVKNLFGKYPDKTYIYSLPLGRSIPMD